jgi:hypothetical protein
VHRFGPGWPWAGIGSIKKTLQPEGSFGEGPGSDIDTLGKVSTLPLPTLAPTVVLIFWGYELTTDRRDSRVPRGGAGSRKLEEAKLSCRTFYESVYTAAHLDAKNWIAQFGCIHLGNAEMSEANVLIEVNGN